MKEASSCGQGLLKRGRFDRDPADPRWRLDIAQSLLLRKAGFRHEIIFTATLALLVSVLCGCSLFADDAFSARASASVVKGFVVEVTIEFGGAGYAYAPLVQIVGGGGSGAKVRAEIEGGVVVRLTVVDAGSRYEDVPQVVIDPPQFPLISAIRMVPEITIQAIIGSDVQVQTTETPTDPASWVILDTRKMEASPFIFVDQSSTRRHRFYRVINLSLYSPASDLSLLAPIAPGQFVMGSPISEVGSTADERPQTMVNLTTGFWISKYEVTQAQYQEVTGTNPTREVGCPNCPVDNVSWNDAVEYCRELTARMAMAEMLPDGYVFRMPTQAEWEYACRAGTTTAYSFGEDPAAIDAYAWTSSDADLELHPVGQKLPNPWGLYDMHGNVQELCHDFYGQYPGGEVVDYQGPQSGESRVRRGGSMGSGIASLRSAARMRISVSPDGGRNFIGFRVVLAPALADQRGL